MIRPVLPLIALAASAALLPGQTLKTAVVPGATAAREGNSLEQRPFGYDRVRLVQYLGLSQLKGLLPARASLTELAYRRDGTVLPNLTMARKSGSRTTTPIWVIRMANYYGNAGNPSPVYPTVSGGGGYATVFTAKKISYPSLPWTGTTLPAFLVRFPLDNPFVYAGAGLLVDHYAYETRGGLFPYLLDAERGKVDGGSFKAFGTSCPAGSCRAYAIPSHPGGLPIEIIQFDGPTNSVTVGVIATSNTWFGAIKLPFDMTLYGLKGCFLNVSIDVLVPVLSNSIGTSRLLLPVPSDSKLGGATFYAQWINFDSRVNPAVGLTFSDGLSITTGTTVGGDPGLDASFVYGLNLGGAVNGKYGLVDKGIALVTRFTYK